jgi:hypothetical protein
MGYVIRDERYEIDGATLVRLMQRVRDREEKRKGILKGQCVEGVYNRKLTLWDKINRWVMR